MKTACFIPIKANSERVPGKNLRILNGKKLYQYICEHVKQADVFDDVYIDTNSAEIASYAEKMGFHVLRRIRQMETICWCIIIGFIQNTITIFSFLQRHHICNQKRFGNALID